MKQSAIPVYESCAVSSIAVDAVVRVQKLNGLTHVVFAETRPSVDSDRKERLVVARLVIPDALVTLVARTILAGVTTGEWIMAHEENTLGSRHDH